VASGSEFIIVDPVKKTRARAFDHETPDLHRRWDYLAKWLQAVEPPREYQVRQP